MNKITNPREAAFLALIHSKNGKYVETFFEEKELSLSDKDLKLAKEISYGTIKRLLSLEYLSTQLASKNKFDKLKLKRKEKFLLYSAIYQYFFMDKVPVFAIVNETVNIAKRWFGRLKASFFNALLRSLDKSKLNLPTGINPSDLSYFYSFPEYFIDEIIKEYGIDRSIEILKSENKIYPPTIRVRPSKIDNDLEIIYDKKFKIAHISSSKLSYFCNNKDYYIQNITPLLLLENSLDMLNNPKNILDLCASPGGKTIALYDLFPSSSFFVNDISEYRLKRLKENLNKYGIDAFIYNESAETITLEQKFDLIVLDVPCSNSGVLGKRHEARWRLNEENLLNMQKTQLSIIKNAEKLLSSSGHILYMTCSILKKENEEVIKKAVSSTSLKLIKNHKILPDIDGKDGGFSSLLSL